MSRTRAFYTVAMARVARSGNLERGTRPAMYWHPHPETWGLHATRLGAKVAWAVSMGLATGADPKYAARHFDKAARNERSFKIVRMDRIAT